MNKNLKEKIIELRELNFSYNEIVSKLGCSKSIVSYYCGNNQKEKTLNRQQKSRLKNFLKRKRENFLARKQKITNNIQTIKKINRILYIKHNTFIGNTKMFTLEELKSKIGPNPKCYLTGRDIDLSKPKTYHLDHVIPVSRGGDNSLDNCNIACKEANQAKSDLLLSEFYQLCKEVINNQQKNDA
jgi:5-methylcytosine-specific restriction endonuclease McrA